MKKTIIILFVVALFLSPVSILNLVDNAEAYEQDVSDFDRIWYDSGGIGFNKAGVGTLILAVTYTNATQSDPSFRTIDYCDINFNNDPFYFSITVEDELYTEYDYEGNIVYQEPCDGYLYLRKSVADSYLPDDIKELASKSMSLSTITFQEVQWYRVYCPDFNREYVWKRFTEPTKDERWFTWGSLSSIRFNSRAMYIQQIKDSLGGLEFDFSHSFDTSGQVVSISKSYLQSKGISIPIFEWGTNKLWKTLPYTENDTHYFINPSHFSHVGIHEAASGYFFSRVDCDNTTLHESNNLDFTTFTEVDTDGVWSVTSTRATCTGADRNMGDYVYKDMGAGYFGNHWMHNFTLSVTSTDNGGIGCLYSVAQELGDFSNQFNSLSIYFNVYAGGTQMEICLRRKSTTMGTHQDEYYVYPHDGTRIYYMVFNRTEDVVTLEIYNDEARTILADTLVESCPANATYRYLYAGSTVNTGEVGDYSWDAYIQYLSDDAHIFNCTRVSSGATERNNFTFTAGSDFYENVIFCIPVSSSVTGIVDATNNTAGVEAVEVDSYNELVNNTYYFDSVSYYIYIKTTNISYGAVVNWTVNCTYGASFLFSPPTFLPVGHPFEFIGLIKDVDGYGLSGQTATVRIIDSDGDDAVTPVEHNCSNGNIFITMATTSLVPGEYEWEVSFVDQLTSITFKTGGNLSLSYGTSGHYEAVAYFTFYNNNTGIGLDASSFKIYVDDTTTLTSADRIYGNTYLGTYTGETLYYRIDDYFDNRIYPTSASYASVTIDKPSQIIDIPIDWYSFSVKNMNHSIVKFKLTNTSRTYTQYLFPYEPFYWDVLGGEYTINLTYYDTSDDSIVAYGESNITINSDTYYWITGYDLQDIIIEIVNTNNTIYDQIVNVGVNINNNGAEIINQTVNLAYWLLNQETNITNQLNLVWLDVNNSNSSIHTQINSVSTDISNLDSSITTQINSVETTISNTETNITNQINLMNTSITNSFTSVTTQINSVANLVENVETNITTQVNDVKISIANHDTNLTNQINSVTVEIQNTNTSIQNQLNAIQSTISNNHLSVIDQINLIWNTMNFTNSTIQTQINLLSTDISNLDSSITTQINSVETSITNTETNITTQLNSIKVDIANHDTNLTNQINSVTIEIQNSNTSIHNQINTIANTISNNYVGIIDQVNLIWNTLNNTESTITTQINGISNSINVFWSDVNTTFTSVQSMITLSETNITNWIDSVNATLLAQLLNVIDNVSSAGMSVFDRVDQVYDEVQECLSGINNITANVTANLSVDLSEVLQNLTYVLDNLSLNNVSIGNLINVSIGDLNNVSIRMWEQQNSSFEQLENRSVVVFNFYNTNEGLGLDRETLKIYVNGSRLVDNLYQVENGSKINLTIKDYYNFTLYQNNFTITAPFTFIDLGLTFHSWLFGNRNDKYYMISLLKEGASRWYERGIVPSGEREFLLPSGNYTMRIYDANWVELHNSSYTMNSSMVYVIHGTNLSVIIAGQSVITGQLLELSSEINYAMMPDAYYWGANPTIVFSCFDKIGMKLGQDVWKVCPAQQLIATTRNSTYGNNFISYPLIPTNGSTLNGTVTIEEDKIYFSGNSSITWVSITYTSNGTLMQNTSYIPGIVYLNGQNVTINASNSINMLRETMYNQVKKFYWDIYNSSDNPGYETGRPGYHVTTIEFNNPLSTPLYNTYAFIGFSDRTSPDGSTVHVTDLSNDNLLLEDGEEFKTTESGIEFKILNGMGAGSSRRFKIEYYKEDNTEYYYDEGTIEAGYIEKNKAYNGEFYNYFEFVWQNNRDKTFRGGLLVKIPPEKIDTEIDKSSVIVWDKDNNGEVDSSKFVIGDTFLLIASENVGSVAPGSGRSYGVYYQEVLLPGTNPQDIKLSTPLFHFIFPWTAFTIIMIVGFAISIFGAWRIINRKGRYRDSDLAMIAIGVCIILIFWILQSKGV